MGNTLVKLYLSTKGLSVVKCGSKTTLISGKSVSNQKWIGNMCSCVHVLNASVKKYRQRPNIEHEFCQILVRGSSAGSFHTCFFIHTQIDKKRTKILRANFYKGIFRWTTEISICTRIGGVFKFFYFGRRKEKAHELHTFGGTLEKCGQSEGTIFYCVGIFKLLICKTNYLIPSSNTLA